MPSLQQQALMVWPVLVWFIGDNSWDTDVWTAPSPPPSCEMEAKAWLGSSDLESNKFERIWLQLATNLACFVWPSDSRILSLIEYAHGPRTNVPGDLHATQQHMLGDVASQIWGSEVWTEHQPLLLFSVRFNLFFFSSDAAAATPIPDAMHEHDPVPAIANWLKQTMTQLVVLQLFLK